MQQPPFNFYTANYSKCHNPSKYNSLSDITFFYYHPNYFLQNLYRNNPPNWYNLIAKTKICKEAAFYLSSTKLGLSCCFHEKICLINLQLKVNICLGFSPDKSKQHLLTAASHLLSLAPVCQLFPYFSGR